MLRILLLILLGVLVYRLLRGRPVIRVAKSAASMPKRKLKATELVRDPVCETYIAVEKALAYEGHFFCSKTCRDKFKELEK